MTPMEKVKFDLDAFKDLIGQQFKETSLNKARAKSYTYCEGLCYSENEMRTVDKKGVKSDFIKTFRVKFNKENDCSMGFSFTYLDIPESEQTIEYSIKFISDRSSAFVNSEKMTVEQFKEKLKGINEQVKLLGENPLYSDVIELVSKSFIEGFATKINYAQKVNNGKKRVRI